MKKSIECWIFDKEKTSFLLLQCPENTKHKSYWQPVTGGIEEGEAEINACLREIQEETGAVLEPKRVQKLLDGFRVYTTDKELHKTVYLVETLSMDVALSDEHVGYQWVKPSEVMPLLLWGSNRATFQRVLDYLDLD
ncbi:MAG: NUDIX domain-containing protein [Proteobacteria bacterium]|nr:NUDIX domain-containing protein [Pseudomonadota bacterium]